MVDPSGLTVLALSACDPTEMYQRMMSEEASKFKLDIEVTDLKILLDDGTEIPSEIVLRDKDMDLAFIRPKTKPASPMAAVDLAKAAPGPGARPGHHPEPPQQRRGPRLCRLGRAYQRRHSETPHLLHPRQQHDRDDARLAGFCARRQCRRQCLSCAPSARKAAGRGITATA